MQYVQEQRDLMRRLFPITRSITGQGLRESLHILGQFAPLTIHEVPTGTPVFDWVIPPEWNIKSAYIKDASGNTIVDMADCNLHVMSYSEPIDAVMPLEILQEHLTSRESLPDAIPYTASYYKRNWGFCMAHRQRLQLKPGQYHVHIDSTLKLGALTYAQCLIPGSTDKEILISAYVCHPSLANNELCGPVAAICFAHWLAQRKNKYTYRFVFAPETIGTLAFLSQNLDHLRRFLVAGFNLSSIGSDDPFVYVRTPQDKSYVEKVAAAALKSMQQESESVPFHLAGSNERQYGSPNIALPVITISKKRWILGDVPEYHSSADSLESISDTALAANSTLLQTLHHVLENNAVYATAIVGEPFYEKYNLYCKASNDNLLPDTKRMRQLTACCDGKRDLLDIAAITGIPFQQLCACLPPLLHAKILYQE